MASTTPISVHGVPYTIPPEPKQVPAIIIALLVHAGLLAFLWVGIKWQNVEPMAGEAEVWDMKTEAAAPPPPPPPQVRPPEPVPVPVPKVVPPPPPPPKVAEPVAPKAPDIALEREKLKKKLLDKKLAEENVAKEKARDVAELQDKEKALAEKKEKELAEKKEKELAEKKASDKAKAAKLAKIAKELAENKLAQTMRDLEMKRITSGVGTNGGAERSTAPRRDPGYYAAIARKIRSNLNYNFNDADVSGNPEAVFQIEQLPTGEIMSSRVVKSSGIPAYDAAIKKAIAASSPLEKKKDGTVERSVPIAFRLKD